MTDINLKVLDVSHHNEVTSFQKIYNFGVRGVIHKASQGTTYIDPNYAANREKAVAAGLFWGAYHFADGSDPVAQANHFVDVAKPDDHTLMALDFEPNGDSTMSLAQARTFIETVEARINRRVVLYSGNLIKETLGDKPDAFWSARLLWLAQYGPKAVVPKAWSKPWLWQFSDGETNTQGIKVPGIAGFVDMNSFDGTDAELSGSWSGASTKPMAAPVAAVPAPSGGVVAGIASRIGSMFGWGNG